MFSDLSRKIHSFSVKASDGALTHSEPDCEISEVLATFSKCLEPLVITHELPVNGSIRFLDLRLYCHPTHTCWLYEPRSNKPLLSFSSAHSKLVKRGIINICFKNALNKSCFHLVKDSFKNQVYEAHGCGLPVVPPNGSCTDSPKDKTN